VSDPNAGLEQLLKQFEDQIRSTNPDGTAILSLFRNWLVPILRDFGMAINQTALGLGEVANAAAAAQSAAEKTVSGDLLMACGDQAYLLQQALDSQDPAVIVKVAAELCDLLIDWMPDEEDLAEMEGAEPEPEPAPEPAPEPEPEPAPVAKKKAPAKKAPAKKTTRKKPAVKEAS